ncbi:hypothetical protein RHMOL_Rhmol02G0163200 [Rhododendron molle]|uniref:Uncharacterized protein n=1 Tax=Rhododendron molle TaxID=49168 RepID=A0ACC0PS64_RHOML|nr:hypothetical protein RHMOL_Rhmol02G0163200 [Rhododendron molle]
MARSSLVFLFVFTITFASLVSNSHGRRLLTTVEEDKREGSLFLNALPKGLIQTSSPSKRGQALATNKNPFHRHRGSHLAAVHRILRSVPSPGVGH